MARDDQAERDMVTLASDSNSGRDPGADAGRLNDAVLWHARLRQDASAESTWIEFAVWLEADNDNRAAFDLVEDLYFALEEAEPHLTPMIDIVRDSSVVSFGAWRTARPFLVRIGALGLGLMAASLLVVIGVRSGDVGGRADHYATGIGEKRTVALADGSTIEMNTDSAIMVVFGQGQRKVALEHGEAVFRVGKDPSRPFLVTVGDRDVRDVGTVFNILSDSGRIVVTVADGKIAVSPHDAADLAARPTAVGLVAGDQLTIQAGHADAVRRIDPAIAMAWREGYLTYKEAPLSLVVSDLNRYFPNRIVLQDSDTGLRRFSGALKVDNEEAVISRLTQLLPLLADRSGDGVITLRLKPQKD
ncbi:MAG: transcriptional regulator [Rhodospirillales bacterium]|nr:transcriptional regulator [Rhodospirillales bacterium]